MTKCPLCLRAVEFDYRLPGSDGGLRSACEIRCRTCGRYAVTDRARPYLESLPAEQRYVVSAVTRRNSTAPGEIPYELHVNEVERVLRDERLPGLEEQVRLVLETLEKHGSGGPLAIEHEIDYPAFGCAGPAALTHLMHSVEGARLISSRPFRDEESGEPHTGYTLDLAGYERLRTERRRARGLTGWDKVDRQLEQAGGDLTTAKTEEQLQAIGLICRELQISLAQAVYDPAKHPWPDQTNPSDADAERMLQAYFDVELKGEDDKLRALVKAGKGFANRLAHKRAATFRDAAICLEGTRSLVEMVAIIEGKRDR